jgi:hypothetical protein
MVVVLRQSYETRPRAEEVEVEVEKKHTQAKKWSMEYYPT